MASEPPGMRPDPSRRWLWLAGAVILALASLPQACGWMMAPEGKIFGGILKNNGDALSYLAKMREGWEGRWLYTDRYAVEPHKPALVYVFYLLLGRLARWSPFSIPFCYQISRVLSGALLLFAVARFLRRIEFPESVKPLAFVLVFTASGLGWLLAAWSGPQGPFEYWVIEAHAFPSMLNYPHFAVATALLAIAFAEMQPTLATKKSALILAASSFALAWVHPRLAANLLAVAATVGVVAWIGDRRFPTGRLAALLAVAFGAAGPLLATFLSLRADPFWRSAADPKMGSPSPDVYLLGYGLLWPLALRGAWIAWRARQPWAYLLIGWMFAGLYIVYLPFGSARRLIHGYNVPLAILAAWAIHAEIAPWLRARLGARRAAASLAAICLFLSLTTWTLLAHEINHLRRRTFPTFYPEALARAGDWLRVNAGRDDVVICSIPTGAMLPGMAGVRVVAGHWAETPNIDGKDGKKSAIEKFFDAETDAAFRSDAIKRYGVKWALVGPRERQIAPKRPYDPADDLLWETAWKDGEIAVYRLKGQEP